MAWWHEVSPPIYQERGDHGMRLNVLEVLTRKADSANLAATLIPNPPYITGREALVQLHT